MNAIRTEIKKYDLGIGRTHQSPNAATGPSKRQPSNASPLKHTWRKTEIEQTEIEQAVNVRNEASGGKRGVRARRPVGVDLTLGVSASDAKNGTKLVLSEYHRNTNRLKAINKMEKNLRCDTPPIPLLPAPVGNLVQ